MDYKKYIAEKLHIDGVSSEELYDLIALPPNLEMGDFALPCFKFAKLMRKSPVAIAEELKTREPDQKKNYRAKIVVVGSEMDDPDFTSLIEDSGALVVADRFCFGALPGRQEIIIDKEKDVLTQICLHYLKTSQCPRFMSHEKVQERRDYVKKLVDEYHADGVLYEQLKFCEYWGYERSLASYVMSGDYGVPTAAVDRQYTASASGQLRTRVQAFVESLEIKKIQKAKEMSKNG